MLLVLPLLCGMVVALPSSASADDVISDVLDPEGDAEGIPVVVGADDVPEVEGAISLEDLLSADQPLVDDEILRPDLSGRSVAVGGSVEGWPAGNLYTSPYPDYLLDVYVPNEDYHDVPWYGLSTRLYVANGEAGPAITVARSLQIHRSRLTAPERVTNAFYSNLFSGEFSNVDELDRPLDLLSAEHSVQGYDETQLLSSNVTFNDLARAGKYEVDDGFIFQLNVIPSSNVGEITGPDREQGRYFLIHFVTTHDPANPPPTVTVDPEDMHAPEGGTARFTAAAPLATSRQWQKSEDAGRTWGDLSGATGTSLTVGPLDMSMDGDLFRMVAKNSSGSTPSNSALLTVLPNPYPEITSHPEHTAVGAPHGVEFSVSAAESVTPLTFRWQTAVDGDAADRGEWADISGAESEVHSIPSTTVDLDGTVYRAILTNDRGFVESERATLSVWVAPGARLGVSPRAVYVTSLD